MNDQVEETIRILKARLAMSEPTPEPPKPIDLSKYKWLATPSAIVLGFALLVIGPRYLPSVDPTPLPLPPAPVVVVPIKIDPADAIATLNGIRLDTERTKLLCDLVNAGEGTFALRYQPVGKAELTRTVVVSGDKPPVPPIPPGPGPGPKPPIPPEPGPDPPPIVDPTTKPTAATYIYEKDRNAVPSAVMSGLNRLNREKKIIATAFEDDSTNGKSGVPEQYKVAYEAAKKEGLPALVITAGDKVLKTIKAPKTEAEVFEAVK